MGRGRSGYDGHIRYKKRQSKKNRESFQLLLGLFSLPLLPILLPAKWIFGRKKKARK